MLCLPSPGLVLTMCDPSDPAHADDVVLPTASGKSVIVRKPPGCTASAAELGAQWAQYQKTGDLTPLVRLLVPGQELPNLRDACIRSMTGAAAWRVPAASGATTCQLHTLGGVPGQQGRLDIVYNKNTKGLAPFLEQAEAAFLAIVRALANNEPVVTGLFDLLAKLLAEAFP
jgi:hypothetical protein